MVRGIPRIEYMRITDLTPTKGNPKDHDLGAIHTSMQEFGTVEPPLWDETTQSLVAGHGRRETWLKMFDHDEEPPEGIVVDAQGHWTTAVIRGLYFENETERDRYILASNRVGELGGWNDVSLAKFMAHITEHGEEQLRGTGFDGEDFQDIINRISPSLASTADTPPDVSAVDASDPPAGDGSLMPPVEKPYGVTVRVNNQADEDELWVRLLDDGCNEAAMERLSGEVD